MKALIHTFITSRWDFRSPLLLALSGGPDSRLLLELLCEVQKQLNFTLAVAHVDHRWRQTSEAEAKELQLLAENRGIPLHLKILDPTSLEGNLEAACREERLCFFRRLCRQHGYQAVLLGHHADDQAETVLKKLFEGVSLPYLNALKPVTVIDALTLWRPMLSIRKEKLIEELQRRSIQAFEDETNQDPRFLRARMRTSILPFLNATFGKSIHAHLRTLGNEAQELQDYLDDRVFPLLSKIVEGPFGSLLDLADSMPLAALELKHLIRSFCKRARINISKQALQDAGCFLAQGASDKSLSSRPGMLFIDRYRLFAIPETYSPVNPALKLTPGEHDFGPWQVLVESLAPAPGCDDNDFEHPDWRSVWKGSSQVILKDNDFPYTLSYARHGAHFQSGTTLRNRWSTAKTPFFLRALVPVIMENGFVKHEFLSGRIQGRTPTNSEPTVKITIKWKNNKKLEKE